MTFEDNIQRKTMQVKIFKANDHNDLKKRVQEFCNSGMYIKNVKFEDFGDNGIKLLVYTDEKPNLKNQEVITLKKTIRGTINFLNKELNNNISCVDTIPFNRDGLIAIVIKNME